MILGLFEFSLNYICDSQVVLVACLAAASASYSGAYNGAYGWASTHGGYYGYAPYSYSAPSHGYYGAGHGGYSGHGGYYAGHGGYSGHGAYHGPLAIPVVLPSGYLADTPEVAHAKSAHLTAVAEASHRAYADGYGYGSGYGYGHGYGHGSYHGPLATPVVLPSGYLADTPEVAAVKAAHLTALAHKGGATHTYGHGYGYGYPHGYSHGYYHH